MLTIAFDLDGTLIDTAPDLIDTLNITLAREGLRPVSFDDARPMIGSGARIMIERALAADGIQASSADIDRMFNGFIGYYSEHIADRSRPFPFLEQTLDRLTAEGHRLAVCTNKIEWLAMKLLKALKLDRRFACICGQDTFKVMKPNPQILLGTIERAGGDPKLAVMIGDSGADIGTARAAKVPVIAVDFGYTEVPIETLHPDRIVSSFADLPAAISAVTSKH